MGWFWRDDDNGVQNSNSGDMADFQNPSPNSDRCSTRRIVHTKCHSEEVEPGKFVKKCEKTEQILRDCVGKPTEVVQSNKEYTEDDVTNEVMKGSSILGSSDVQPFDFPGLRSDIEAIEHSIFGGINRFFEAADEMRNEFFHLLDDPSSLFGRDSSSCLRNRAIPFEGDIKKKPDKNENDSGSGSLDLPSLAKDV